jgi:hypothetical protein
MLGMEVGMRKDKGNDGKGLLAVVIEGLAFALRKWEEKS